MLSYLGWRSSTALVARMSSNTTSTGAKKATTPTGRLDDQWSNKKENMDPQKVPEVSEEDAYKPFPNDKNPVTGEIGGPKGPEPTRYGDWNIKGRCIDF